MPGKKISINISNLSFSYPGLEQYIIRDFTASITDGWTAVSGNNGSGKSTLLKLIGGELAPDAGSISISGSFYYCRQNFNISKADLEDFCLSYINRDHDAGKLAALLRIKNRWIYNSLENGFSYTGSLSEGEKKRLQIACALFKNPDILAVDEPFNHVDENGRLFILESLSRYRGCGLIVSHDREITDRLCSSTIVISRGCAEHRKGSVSGVFEQLESENMSRKNEFRKLKEDLDKLKKESVRRKGKAERADRRRSKRGISGKDHDAKARIDLARFTGKDGHAGKLSRQIESRIRKKEEELSKISFYEGRKSGISITNSKKSGDTVITAVKGKIRIGDKELVYPDLIIRPGEKIALTGSNGSGKTTLIRYLISRTDEEEILYIPQEFDDERKREIISGLEQMQDKKKGEVYSNFSRLGSDPVKLIESLSPSPGEWKKLYLSMGILDNPFIIILDEPVNHMDLSSIKSLEEALNSISCAMLVTSHDAGFRKSVTDREWKIYENKEENILEIVF